MEVGHWDGMNKNVFNKLFIYLSNISNLLTHIRHYNLSLRMKMRTSHTKWKSPILRSIMRKSEICCAPEGMSMISTFVQATTYLYRFCFFYWGWHRGSWSHFMHKFWIHVNQEKKRNLPFFSGSHEYRWYFIINQVVHF